MEVKHNGRSLEHMEDKAFVEWLESIGSTGYQRQCRDCFLEFLEFLEKSEGWVKPTGDSVIQRHNENRKSDNQKTKFFFDDVLPKFVDWLKETRGLEHNSAVSKSQPIRGFFKFHREPLKIQRGKLEYVEKTKKYHVFQRDELARMVKVGTLEKKAIILLGKDEGIRVGDFIKQKRKPIIDAFKNFNGTFPLEFEVETEKEGVVAVVHAMQETWDALQDYWSNVSESEFVFPSASSSTPISEDKVNYALKNCWDKAYPDRKDTMVRFHELRSFKMTALSNVGINEWHIKRMVGKKVSRDILTYLRGIDLKADFVKAEQGMRLTGQFTGRNHELINSLEESITKQQVELSDMKTRLEAVTNQMKKQNEQGETILGLVQDLISLQSKADPTNLPERLRKFRELREKTLGKKPKDKT